MKRIRILFLALVLLAPLAAPCAEGEDGRAQTAINELNALKLDRVELTSLTVEADKVRVEGRAFSAAQISGLMRMIEKDIGTPDLQEISPVQSGNRRFNHFTILIAPYAGDAHSRLPAAAGAAEGK